VDADVHVGRRLTDAVVVEGDIFVKQLVDRTGVERVLFPAGDHLFGAEVCMM
jgi:hypothetical protein